MKNKCECKKTAEGSAGAFSEGLEGSQVFADGLANLWPYLNRTTQLDVLNQLRQQPKAILSSLQMRILEARLKSK